MGPIINLFKFSEECQDFSIAIQSSFVRIFSITSFDFGIMIMSSDKSENFYEVNLRVSEICSFHNHYQNNPFKTDM